MASKRLEKLFAQNNYRACFDRNGFNPTTGRMLLESIRRNLHMIGENLANECSDESELEMMDCFLEAEHKLEKKLSFKKYQRTS